MPTIQSPSSLQVFSASNNPELVTLLVTGKTGTNGEYFFQKFQSLLRKTPKLGTTSKPEFFPYSAMGAFTVLPNTPLMDKLDIKHIYINPIKSNDKGKQVIKTVKVALQLESAGKKSLQLYTFCVTKNIESAQHWSSDQIKELIAHLEIVQGTLQDYVVDEKLQVNGKIYHIDQTFNLHIEDIKIVLGDNFKSYKELSSEFQRLIERDPLPKPNEQNTKFKEIVQLIEERFNSEISESEKVPLTNLKSHFQQLSSHAELEGAVDEQRRVLILDQIANAVAVAGSNIFKDLAKIYGHWKPILGLGSSEVAYHGFNVGVLEYLFKYEYALDIGIEKNLGKGRADLVFVSRLDGLSNKNWEALPVNVEFKAGSETPLQGLEQIDDRGYLYYAPRIRTIATKGIALGVNFAFPEPVVSRIKDIKIEPTNFIKTLLEVGDAVLQTEGTQALSDRIAAGLNDLHYSIVMNNEGNDNSYYLDRLLLGQAMGSTADISAKVFINTHNKAKYPKEDGIFLFKRGSNVYVLNIIRNVELFTGHELNQVPSFEELKKLFGSDELLESSQYVKINVILTLDGRSNCIKKIELNKESLKSHSDESGRLGTRYNLADKGIFEPIQAFSFIDDQGELAVQRLAEELFNKKVLINSESDLQAIVQGGLLASGKLQVFTESNHLLAGIADIVASPIKRGNNKRLKVMELKHAENHQEAKQRQAEALVQVKKYLENLKSFSDGREVDLVALTYDAQARQGENLFLYTKLIEKIVHTSGSERVANSPEHRDVEGEKSPPYFQPEPNKSDNPKVEMLPVDETGDKTPPWKSPDPGYAADLESSPEKNKSDASVLGNIFGGIIGGLGVLLAAFTATAAAVGKAGSGVTSVASSVASAINAIRTSLSGLRNTADRETGESIQEIEQLLDDIAEARVEQGINERIARQKERAEKLAEKYKRQGEKVEKKIREKRKQAEEKRTENKRKKALCEVGPSHSKRDVSCRLPTNELPSVPLPNSGRDAVAGSIPSGITGIEEWIPNKLFSLCRIRWDKEEEYRQGNNKTLIESSDLDCYLEIDYQDEDATLVDVSLWDLADKTIHYEDCRDELTLSLSLLNDRERKLVLANASQMHYELIDRHATIFKPVLNTTQSCWQTNEPEEVSTERLKSGILTTTVNSLEIDAEKNRQVVISDCSMIEISASYDGSYFAGACIINPIANAIDVIEIHTAKKNPVFIKFSSWCLLQQIIEYSGADNSLVITVNNSDARIARTFRVKIRDYLRNSELSFSWYRLIDKYFYNVVLVFTEKDFKAINRGANVPVTGLNVKASIPESVLNKEGDKASHAVAWYEKITATRNDDIAVLYAEIMNPDGSLRVFGSRFDDRFAVGENVRFVYGGEGRDIYIVLPGGIKRETHYIDNEAKDSVKDCLVLPASFNTIQAHLYNNNSLALSSTQQQFSRRVVLTNFCKSLATQHLEVLTKDGFLFEPPDCELLESDKEFRQIVRNFRSDSITEREGCIGINEDGQSHTVSKRAVKDDVSQGNKPTASNSATHLSASKTSFWDVDTPISELAHAYLEGYEHSKRNHRMQTNYKKNSEINKKTIKKVSKSSAGKKFVSINLSQNKHPRMRGTWFADKSLNESIAAKQALRDVKQKKHTNFFSTAHSTAKKPVSLTASSQSAPRLVRSEPLLSREIYPFSRLTHHQQGKGKSQNKPYPLARVTASPNVTDTLFVLNVFARAITRQKYSQPISKSVEKKYRKAERQRERIKTDIFRGSRIWKP